MVAEDMEAELPLGTIGAGTFSNQRLIADAMKGVAAEVSLRGCDEPERFETYVVETPQGEPGQRYWHELWLVYGCDDEISIDIRFQETGLHSALWVID
ncbi:MAG: hypothetical protein OIF57_11695 [Marinobacterium sp.]|nr:hypothetical protein [Marinobacterium sp.]